MTDTFLWDAFALPSFQCLVNTQRQRPVGRKSRDEQTDQDFGGLQSLPLRSIKNARIVLKAGRVRKSHDTQSRRYGSLALSENASNKQNLNGTKTEAENGGAKGVRTAIILSGKVSMAEGPFWRIDLLLPYLPFDFLARGIKSR